MALAGHLLGTTSLHNFMVAHMPLPSNLHLTTWDERIQSAEEVRVVEFLHFCFPQGYEGPLPTPDSSNHTSAINHARDVDTYVVTEVKEGAMMGPFHAPPPFHTLVPGQCPPYPPQKGEPLRRVTMDLSWLHPPNINVNSFTPMESSHGELKNMHLLLSLIL